MIDILLVGLSLGCVYGFVAVGFTLIYRTTGVMNFSQGAFVMLGGMGAGYVSEEWGLPLPLAALVGVLVAGLGGLVLVGGLVLPLWRRGASDFIVILSTLLFLLAVQNIVLNVMGSDPRRVPPVPGVPDLRLGSIRVDGQVLCIVVVAVLATVLLGLFLTKTLLGTAMRAVATDRSTSRMLGISPERIAIVAFVGAALLGGLGGVLIAPIQVATWSSAHVYNINGFIAAIMGGLLDVKKALFGGFVVGIGQALIALYISTTYLELILLLVLVALLLLKPNGIFSRRVAVKY
ncbi:MULTISPECIES: branched-chain amino acid ABC transporter permease [unclassified Nocardioides]|uniref:branched-chain amino acid ABC transporter permease n=1 Tax=unclassified Nocardioides TaxID=2615069 RepID=UPI0009F14669|nr:MULTISPECIES: branched-chain amino acid ABC transporter permease [unclassified Nocardioides]GAW52393.1 Inner-membrane translocator [Nocardioides sp. PD653-B2]GAW53937.1 Inner-membrane translocator [Nocardioides sp. PD653]